MGPVKESQLSVKSATQHRGGGSQLGVGWWYEVSKPQGELPTLGRSVKSPDYIDESSNLSTV